MGRGDRYGFARVRKVRMVAVTVGRRIAVAVGIGVLALLVSGVVGLAALSSTSTRARELYEHSAKPLGALGDLRDMEGDSRVEVWHAIAAGNNKARRNEAADAIKEADDGL